MVEVEEGTSTLLPEEMVVLAAEAVVLALLAVQAILQVQHHPKEIMAGQEMLLFLVKAVVVGQALGVKMEKLLPLALMAVLVLHLLLVEQVLHTLEAVEEVLVAQQVQLVLAVLAAVATVKEALLPQLPERLTLAVVVEALMVVHPVAQAQQAALALSLSAT